MKKVLLNSAKFLPAMIFFANLMKDIIDWVSSAGHSIQNVMNSAGGHIVG